MAIYHYSLSTGSRQGGQSASAKFSYITRQGKYSRSKDELLDTASGNMPAWVKNPNDYWMAADTYERENGRLFIHCEFALPRELNDTELRRLAADYCKHAAGEYGLPYSYAIHRGEYDHRGNRTGTKNPHVHLMLSERALDDHDRTAETWFKRANKKDPSRGGAAKCRALKSTDWLEKQRELWATVANGHLAMAGSAAHIDHRTLEAQGIDRRPTTHIGVMETNRARQELAKLESERRRVEAELRLHPPPILYCSYSELLEEQHKEQTRQNQIRYNKEQLEQVQRDIAALDTKYRGLNNRQEELNEDIKSFGRSSRFIDTVGRMFGKTSELKRLTDMYWEGEDRLDRMEAQRAELVRQDRELRRAITGNQRESQQHKRQMDERKAYLQRFNAYRKRHGDILLTEWLRNVDGKIVPDEAIRDERQREATISRNMRELEQQQHRRERELLAEQQRRREQSPAKTERPAPEKPQQDNSTDSTKTATERRTRRNNGPSMG